MSEYEPTSEIKKDQWLGKLTDFLAESCWHGWAAGAEKSKNPATGEKVLIYSRDDWVYKDTYTGYFAAPGETKVFYKGRHVWNMQYGGEGQRLEYYDEVKETYDFLKEALMHFDPDLPLRGPREYYSDGDIWSYHFKLIEGNLENGIWREDIDKRTDEKGNFRVFFSQVGTCGVIIDKNENFQPIYPWNL